MKAFLCLVVCLPVLLSPRLSHAWGRHDVMTKITLDQGDFSVLAKTPVVAESIDQAAPDLVARVLPSLLKWCELYHAQHDRRYDWKIPETLPAGRTHLSAREKLLWDLEDNMDTPLELGKEKTAAEMLIHFVSEPDGLLDGDLERSPYRERLRESMSYFGGNDANTHAFRHYYVPTSLLPPIIEPKGIAPYRAALYAKLSEGAFDTGHAYWGYRFLAWSIHYTQDVTQPWHTIFLPGVSFLNLSKEKMKHDVSALHYLTEAFADAWMGRARKSTRSSPPEDPDLSSSSEYSGPWFVAELTERLALQAHRKAAEVADLARTLFAPVVGKLNAELKPVQSLITFGGMEFNSTGFDFDDDGKGATAFLAPMWQQTFALTEARDRLLKELVEQLNSAIGGSRTVISHVLGNIHSDQLLKFKLDPTEGSVVGSPS